MKKIIIVILFLKIALISISQENFSMIPGRMTQYEMDMTEYEKDSEAEALIIFDKGEYKLIYEESTGFLLEMKRKTKIKILSQAGEEYASFNIPYYIENARSFERVYDIKGTTYNFEDGNLITSDFDRKNIFEEKLSDKLRTIKLTLPNVKTGSVVEIEYTICTPYFFNMRTWAFQAKIPTVYSELQYRAIPYYEYVYSAINLTELDINTSEVLPLEIRHGRLVYKEMLYTFGLKDVPAFRDEEFITSSKDYIKALKFQLSRTHSPNHTNTKEYITTWPELNKEFLKHSDFGKAINDYKKEAKKILPLLELKDKTELEKIKAITEYVKHDYNWNGSYSAYSSKKASELLKTKTGNSGDLNLFLIGLLQEADIKVKPVILSTRGNGTINKSYPFLHIFDYVIAEATSENRALHLDATEPLLPFNALPTRCINIEGLIIQPQKEEWTFLSQKGLDYAQRDLILEINPLNGQIEMDGSFSFSGYSAYQQRASSGGKEEDLTKFLKSANNIDVIGEITINNYEELEKPFSYSFRSKTGAEKASDKIFIRPFCGLEPRENIFKQKERILPIDLIYLIARKYTSQIKIPTGYKVEYLPTNWNFSNDEITILYTAKEDEGVVEVDIFYKFNSNIYGAEHYEALKSKYGEMLFKISEMIVLEKDNISETEESVE